MFQLKLNQINQISKPEYEIKLKVPELRYKKVPTLPEEPPEINLTIPNELNIDDIKPPVMFNEDIPNYYDELIKMGYSEDAVDMLEGIPNLDDCKRFIDYYKEESSNLTGKKKGLFELINAKTSEIIFTLLMYENDNLSHDSDEYYQNQIQPLIDKYGGVEYTDSGFKFKNKLTSIDDLQLYDKIMVENHGRNLAKMCADFQKSLQGGNHIEKEIYDPSINYLTDKHNTYL